MKPVTIENPKVTVSKVDGVVVAVDVLLRKDVPCHRTKIYPQSGSPNLLIDVDSKGAPVAMTIVIGYPPEKNKLGHRTPKEISVVETSFQEWRDQPRPSSMTICDLIRDAFHVGYHRGMMNERHPDDPD